MWIRTSCWTQSRCCAALGAGPSAAYSCRPCAAGSVLRRLPRAVHRLLRCRSCNGSGLLFYSSIWKAVVRHRRRRSGQRPLLVPSPTAPLRSHPASVSGGPAANLFVKTRRPSSSAAFRRRLVHCTASCLARSWLDLGWVRWVRREYCPRRCINATQGLNPSSTQHRDSPRTWQALASRRNWKSCTATAADWHKLTPGALSCPRHTPRYCLIQPVTAR